MVEGLLTHPEGVSGEFEGRAHQHHEVEHSLELLGAGAGLVDIGGAEQSRPGTWRGIAAHPVYGGSCVDDRGSAKSIGTWG